MLGLKQAHHGRVWEGSPARPDPSDGRRTNGDELLPRFFEATPRFHHWPPEELWLWLLAQVHHASLDAEAYGLARGVAGLAARPALLLLGAAAQHQRPQ